MCTPLININLLPFLLRIAKGNVNPQRVEVVEKNSYNLKSQLTMMQPWSRAHQATIRSEEHTSELQSRP